MNASVNWSSRLVAACGRVKVWKSIKSPHASIITINQVALRLIWNHPRSPIKTLEYFTTYFHSIMDYIYF